MLFLRNSEPGGQTRYFFLEEDDCVHGLVLPTYEKFWATLTDMRIQCVAGTFTTVVRNRFDSIGATEVVLPSDLVTYEMVQNVHPLMSVTDMARSFDSDLSYINHSLGHDHITAWSVGDNMEAIDRDLRRRVARCEVEQVDVMPAHVDGWNTRLWTSRSVGWATGFGRGLVTPHGAAAYLSRRLDRPLDFVVCQREKLPEGCVAANYELGVGEVASSDRVSITSITQRGISPQALKLYLLSYHYRTAFRFDWGALESWEHTLDRWFSEIGDSPGETTSNDMIETMQRDLDTGRVLDTMRNTNGCLAVPELTRCGIMSWRFRYDWEEWMRTRKRAA